MDTKLKTMRQKAEYLASQKITDISALTDDEIRSVIHNLEVHKIELEMQNAELHTAQQNLRAARDNYFQLFEQSSVGLVALNAAFSIENINEFMTQLLGLPKNKLLNKQFTNFIDHDYQDDFFIAKRRLTFNNQKQNILLKLKKESGHEVWVNCQLVVLQKKESYLLTCTDISETKRNEELSAKRQSEVEELLHATHAILKSNDFTETAHEVFQACKRSIGAKAGYVALLADDGEENELLFLDDGGLPCAVDPSLPMPVRGLRAEAYKTGKVVYDNDFMNSKWVQFMPDKHLELKNVLFAPLLIDNKAVGLLGLSNKTDGFTENDKQLAEAFAKYAAIALLNSRTIKNLEQRASELADLNAMKDKLFSIIGHDLRNPVSSIVSYTELMFSKHETLDDEKRHKFSKYIYESSQKVSNLLDNLLNWSRVRQGKMKIYAEDCNLHELINECFGILETAANLKNINLQAEVVDNIPLRADKYLLTTTLRNLLSNAVKFTRNNGIVGVKAYRQNNQCVFEIWDTGIGMNQQQLDKLFMPDDKHSSVGTSGEPGTGLGLIICKEFVDKMGGKLQVQSAPGEGTSFFVYLPLEFN